MAAGIATSRALRDLHDQRVATGKRPGFFVPNCLCHSFERGGDAESEAFGGNNRGIGKSG